MRYRIVDRDLETDKAATSEPDNLRTYLIEKTFYQALCNVTDAYLLNDEHRISCASLYRLETI